MEYQDINAKTIDRWVEGGWEWGIAVSHEEYERALRGDWNVALTPNKEVPQEWFGCLRGRKALGLASGGGQQMPLFAAAGAVCTVLDYSEKQLESERMVAKREGYEIKVIWADMTKPLPFEDEVFDLIFHPVSNCYIEEVEPVFRECYRILKDGGVLLSGLDNGMNFIFDNDEKQLQNTLPFNPLKDAGQMNQLEDTDSGVQFSHTIEEQVGGQLEAGFILTHILEDTNSEGNLKAHNIPCFLATRAVKRKDIKPCQLIK